MFPQQNGNWHAFRNFRAREGPNYFEASLCLHRPSLVNTLFAPNAKLWGLINGLSWFWMARLLFAPLRPLDDLNRFCFSPFFMSQEDPCGKRSFFSISPEKNCISVRCSKPSLLMLLVEGTERKPLKSSKTLKNNHPGKLLQDTSLIPPVEPKIQ